MTKLTKLFSSMAVATTLILATAANAGMAENISNGFNASGTPAKLVASGWASNNGGKGYKILHIVATDTKKSVELQIDGTGKSIKAMDNTNPKMNYDYDYKMSSDMKGWAEMGTGENGPMYHMTPVIGALSFDGPMVEAMKNMGPFADFLVIIGKEMK